jgi:hypothetical protein
MRDLAGKRVTGIEFPAKPLVQKPDVLTQALKDDGVFPNSKLPLLLYRKAVGSPEQELASVLERLFAAHGWRGSWRNGIYPYHHQNIRQQANPQTHVVREDVLRDGYDSFVPDGTSSISFRNPPLKRWAIFGRLRDFRRPCFQRLRSR